MKKPLVIAHRCGPSLYPEQTIQSARYALAQGADWVEMDVQYTADEIPVICHDGNAKRIFGVDRKIGEMSAKEFMTLRHTADRAYASHTLEDVIASEVRPLLLHCKNIGKEQVIEAVRSLGADCMLGVMSTEDLKAVRRAGIKALAFMPVVQDLEAYIDAEADVIRLWEDWVTEERVMRIHAAGRECWVMSGKCTQEGVGHTDEGHIRLWMELGVDGVLINDVAWARRIMKS